MTSFTPTHRIDVADMPPYSLFVTARNGGYFQQDGKEYKIESGDSAVDLRDDNTVNALEKIGALMVDNARLYYEANEHRATEQSLRKHIQELQNNNQNLKVEKRMLEVDLCLMKDVIRHMLEKA